MFMRSSGIYILKGIPLGFFEVMVLCWIPERTCIDKSIFLSVILKSINCGGATRYPASDFIPGTPHCPMVRVKGKLGLGRIGGCLSRIILQGGLPSFKSIL